MAGDVLAGRFLCFLSLYSYIFNDNSSFRQAVSIRYTNHRCYKQGYNQLYILNYHINHNIYQSNWVYFLRYCHQ